MDALLLQYLSVVPCKSCGGNPEDAIETYLARLYLVHRAHIMKLVARTGFEPVSVP